MADAKSVRGKTPVDPRFEARRAAVERDLRRRRRNQLLGAIALVAAGLGVYGLTRSPLLDVDHIQVIGGTRTGVDAAVAASGVARGNALMDVDGSRAQVGLEALPWVRSARVARSWPGTVRISIVERKPVAKVARAGGGWFLIDASGRLVEQVEGERKDLLTFDGVVEEAEAGQTLVDLAAGAASVVERFGPQTAAFVRRVRFTPNQELEFDVAVLGRTESTSAGGGSVQGVPPAPGVVRFGRIEEVPEKLLSLETWLTTYKTECLFELDVRVPRSPTAVHDSLC